MNLLSSIMFVLSLTDTGKDENDVKNKPDKHENDQELRKKKKKKKEKKTVISEPESSDSGSDTGDSPINIGRCYMEKAN